MVIRHLTEEWVIAGISDDALVKVKGLWEAGPMTVRSECRHCGFHTDDEYAGDGSFGDFVARAEKHGAAAAEAMLAHLASTHSIGA